MEKFVERMFSVVFIILGIFWESIWIYEAINFNSNSACAGQYACMILMFIVVSPIIGLLYLDELLKPFRD